MLNEIYETERARIAALAGGKYEGDFASPVFGEGSPDSPLMLIGEAPGASEAAEGRPFVGKAGAQLDRLLAGAGIDRSRVFVTNAVKYRPTRNRGRSNRTPTAAELRPALPSLAAELGAASPLITATLGNTPLRALCMLAGAEPVAIGAAHGRVLKLRIGGREYSVFPLYHPASCIYNRGLIDILNADVVKLSELMRYPEGGK